jgi:hypothetical protein
MNYSFIEDIWPNYNNRTKIEKFENESDLNNNIKSTIPTKLSNININDKCLYFYNHIKKCDKCRMKYNYLSLTYDKKDIIIFILSLLLLLYILNDK